MYPEAPRSAAGSSALFWRKATEQAVKKVGVVVIGGVSAAVESILFPAGQRNGDRTVRESRTPVNMGN
ncbi:MAG: hypothetical protein C4B58_16460 [Deltaproteobacteria bacterium]|nr:MAG: hypothetical protein C4B58_16460 [Deltaproteobacteria bacterium]